MFSVEVFDCCAVNFKIMELLLCPCGKGCLIRKVTKKGPNVNRPYYKCPGSSMVSIYTDFYFRTLHFYL